MSALTTFHPFPRLPAELRLKVFRLTLDSQPREVQFLYNEVRTNTNFRLPRYVGALLLTSKEASNETKAAYKPIFSFGSRSSEIMFNPSVDTLYLTILHWSHAIPGGVKSQEADDMLRILPDEDCNQVKSLVITYNSINIQGVLSKFTNLNRLSIVPGIYSTIQPPHCLICEIGAISGRRSTNTNDLFIPFYPSTELDDELASELQYFKLSHPGYGVNKICFLQRTWRYCED